MPTMDWDCQFFAESIQSVKLIVDQSLQRANIDCRDGCLLFVGKFRNDWKKGGFCFSTCGCSTNQEVPVFFKDALDRLLLDGPEFLPAHFENRSLDQRR